MTGIVKESVGMSKRQNRDFDFDGGRAAPFNDDVLTEILFRLPVKLVIRFQSVSKSWLSLISSNEFRRLNTLRRRKAPLSLILESHRSRKVNLFYSDPKRIEKLTKMMTPFDINVVKNFKILSCSNGLMLMQCDNDYYVHNPTTHQSKKLSLAHSDKFIRIRSIHLVFDPSQSPHYDIVCIRVDKECFSRNQIEVFSSESGSWRVCVEPFTTIDGQLLKNISSCVRYKSLVFLIYCNTYDYECDSVYCFDIVKNVSELVVCRLPELGEAAYWHSIQESNGCLYCGALLEDGQIKKWAASWELRVNMDNPCSSKWEMKYRYRARFLDWLNGKRFTFIGEARTVLIHFSHKIVAYNFRRKSYKNVLKLEDGISCVNILKFGETLTPL